VGTGPEQALSGAFAAVAARSGRQLIVSDVVPPGASDCQALSSWFVVLSVLIPSLAAGSASALAFRRARRAWAVATPVAAALVSRVVTAAIADGSSFRRIVASPPEPCFRHLGIGLSRGQREWLAWSRNANLWVPRTYATGDIRG
jgi:hypothetical protein